jgi:integrase
VIHYQPQPPKAGQPITDRRAGRPVKKLRTGWKSIARAAGAGSEDSPHIMRHTAATWQMQSGTNPAEAAGYLGMSLETLWEVYGHHHPDYQPEAAAADGRRKDAAPRVSGAVSGAQRSTGGAK